MRNTRGARGIADRKAGLPSPLEWKQGRPTGTNVPGAGLRILHALACILLGFFLASSSFAPGISRFVSSLIRLLQ
jgi:hypothetical protein